MTSQVMEKLVEPVPLKDQSVIKLGEYIVLQKGNFLKIHQLSKNCCIMLGRDKIDLTNIIGQKYWTNFKMVHKKGSKREFELVTCDKSESLLNLMDKDVRGIDNRNIWDDGSSQSMSAEEIIKLRDKGCSGQDIVGHLLENSKTFHCKTEYSQQKYLKKKEKKYFEYVIVHRPNVRIIAQILYSKDPQKVLNLRFDTLAQIVTAVNLQPSGNYILFESGCQGLVSALVLNHLAGNGRLIHLFPNVHYQKHAVLAMNFSQRELNSFISIRLSTFLKKMFPEAGDKTAIKESVVKISDSTVEKTVDTVSTSVNISEGDKDSTVDLSSCENFSIPTELAEGSKVGKDCQNGSGASGSVNENRSVIEETQSGSGQETNELSDEEVEDATLTEENCKRKCSEPGGDAPAKKFKWEMEVDKAVDILSAQKADGLIIICKEYPIYLINRLIKLVAFSRNIVIFSMFQEPIVKLYCELKLRKDVIALRLTESFLRNYQVLPDRTHPEINMSSSGGFLLTATVVSPEEIAT